MPDPYQRPPRKHPIPKPESVYQRIMRAAADGVGLRLSADEVATIAADVDRLEHATRPWVSIENQMPPDSTLVLVYCPTGLYGPGQPLIGAAQHFHNVKRGLSGWFDAQWEYEYSGITHWRSLPSPPISALNGLPVPTPREGG